MFLNNVTSALCDGFHGGSEIAASALENWLKNRSTQPLILCFKDGETVELRPTRPIRKTAEDQRVEFRVRRKK